MKSAHTLFLQMLQEKLKEPLPGFSIQQKLEPATRKQFPDFPSADQPARESAVLILLFLENDEFCTVFIRRNQYDGVHSGQVAFPGGKMEKNDASHVETALRETWEEIGVPPEKVSVLGMLSPLYIPPSNFNVQPVVGMLSDPVVFKADASEVAEIFTVPLHSVLDEANEKTTAISLSNNLTIDVPCYELGNHIIWGATSMILSEFIEITKKTYQMM